jgi:hypothetical protein
LIQYFEGQAKVFSLKLLKKMLEVKFKELVDMLLFASKVES